MGDCDNDVGRGRLLAPDRALRFSPQFVVVSVFLNDFGGTLEVGGGGKGDWQEGKYWLAKIVDYCRERRWRYLPVPAPYGPVLEKKRNSGYYPRALSNILENDSLMYLYPIEDFANAHLRLRNEAARHSHELHGSPLFNGAIGDGHFSAAGSEVWARAVGERLVLLLNREPVANDASKSVAREPKKMYALKRVGQPEFASFPGQKRPGR